METRGNYALIGIFALAVLAAGFGFVLWFSGTETGAKRTAYQVEFTGSVAGLSKGAAVLFNGIRVGEVTDVYFEPARPQQAFAKIEVQPDTPVKTDTRAALDVQILSGTGVIALNGGSPTAANLVKGPGQQLPTIVADKGGLANLLETARGTADRATALVDSLNLIVSSNQEAISRTVRNAEAFSKALSDNAPQLNSALASIGSAATRVGPLAERLELLANDASALVRAVEPERVNRIVRNVDEVAQTIGANRGRVETVLTDASALMRSLNQSATKIDGALASFTAAADSVAPAAGKLGALSEEAGRAAGKLGALSDDAGRVVRAVDPTRVGRIVDNVDGLMATVGAGRERVAEILRSTASLTQRLNDTAPKFDELTTGLVGLVENVTPVAGKVGTLVDETTTRVRSLEPQQLRQIVDNANRFAASLSRASPDVEATARNASQLTAKFNASADKIDGVLKAVQNFLGSATGREGQSTFESIRLAADAFRKASENLDRRATQIAEGVSRFSGTGSRQVEALGTDARRAVNAVGRAATNLERNPSSVIFGGSRAPIPEFSGR